MRSRAIGAAMALAALVSACGGEDPVPSGAPLERADSEARAERTENGAPFVERIALHPPRPLPGQRIEARIEVSDPDGDPVRLALEWRQNGRVILSGTQTSITPDRMVKDQEIEVMVTATDGTATSVAASASVRVGNTEPLIEALYLAPDGEVAPGQEVTAAPQAADADGDSLEYEFQWLLNGRVVSGADEARFDTAKLKRGDRLQAKVRVSDGEAWSPVAESMTLELANRAPRFTGLPKIEASDGAFRASLEAEDPDGDGSLRFRLIQGPQGLVLDPMTGQVSWRPGQDETGTHPVEVAVGDSFGKESAMRFQLTVSASGGASPPPAKKSDTDEETEPAEE